MVILYLPLTIRKYVAHVSESGKMLNFPGQRNGTLLPVSSFLLQLFSRSVSLAFLERRKPRETETEERQAAVLSPESFDAALLTVVTRLLLIRHLAKEASIPVFAMVKYQCT